MKNDLDHWFVREVLVHEAALMQYLRRSWPRREDILDLRQETYVRIYEAARQALPQSPRAFLFTTARNLMADRVRRAKVVAIESMGDFESSNVYWMDEVSPEQWFGGRQMLHRLADAMNGLPARCREVVWLRRVEDLPQKQVARQLGISEKTVEKHLAKGMRLLADGLHGTRLAPVRDTAAMADEDAWHERQHGD